MKKNKEVNACLLLLLLLLLLFLTVKRSISETVKLCIRKRRVVKKMNIRKTYSKENGNENEQQMKINTIMRKTLKKTIKKNMKKRKRIHWKKRKKS